MIMKVAADIQFRHVRLCAQKQLRQSSCAVTPSDWPERAESLCVLRHEWQVDGWNTYLLSCKVSHEAGIGTTGPRCARWQSENTAEANEVCKQKEAAT